MLGLCRFAQIVIVVLKVICYLRSRTARSTVEIACYFELLNFSVLTNPENGGLCIP